MADYEDILDSEVEPGAPLLSSIGFRLRDNAIAIAQGAAGAPRVVYGALNLSNDITQGDLSSSSVGRAQLKTTQSTNTSSSGGSDTVTTEVPGGQYAFYPRYWMNTTARLASLEFFGSTSSANQSIQAKLSSTASDDTLSVRSIYVQSSPPYDLGDGEVHGFIYARVKSSGEVTGVYMSEDPPWYGTTWGGTPEYFFRDGELMGRWRKRSVGVQDVLDGSATIDQWHRAEMETEELKITKEVKTRGMESRPHPFTLGKDDVPVLIDPMGDETARLMKDMLDGENPGELLIHGFIKVDNETISRGGPTGVAIHAMRWSNRK